MAGTLGWVGSLCGDRVQETLGQWAQGEFGGVLSMSRPEHEQQSVEMVLLKPWLGFALTSCWGQVPHETRALLRPPGRPLLLGMSLRSSPPTLADRDAEMERKATGRLYSLGTAPPELPAGPPG